MTIAACLYHGEVIFPRPDEIVNGRYVRRRPRRPPIVDFSQETNESIITKGLVCKIGQVSRPVSFFRFGPWIDWNYCRMRDHVRRMILDRPENKVRAMLRKLEGERRKCASEYSEAENKLAEFRRDDSDGYLAAKGWTVLGILAKIEKLKSAVSEARCSYECACMKLEEFKQEVLYPMWKMKRP